MITIHCGIGCHLDAKILKHGQAVGPAQNLCHVFNLGHLNACKGGVFGDGKFGQGRDHRFRAPILILGMFSQPVVVDQILLHQLTQNGRQQPGIPAWLDAQMDIRQLRRLRHPWVDHD